MDNIAAKKRGKLKPMYYAVPQKRQKRMCSALESPSAEILPKLKSNTTKEDIYNRLKDLVGLPCATNADKFHLLRRRDMFLCKLRDIILSTAAGGSQVTQGNCPDMCPEKERYMRDAKKAVHFYECNSNGQMDHEKMVKDYSRSAADQDTPLAHELRPLKTLQFTMDYLIFNIANEMPSTNAELARWYDFLWSRTRAIRKDITQQMLCNESAVDLVEKCARLHIFASFRLITLEADLFDHKMNTENLSKSLQTLRHMYEDLAKKHVNCQNEPEFRSYDIILNLTDFNVHSQVLAYRETVRDDPQVQLALSLAAALQNNNYIRFFRIVRHQATFLQACLCHHFFNLIRANALKVICMAYNIFPLDAFAEYLAFDSQIDGLKFIRQFFLELDAADQSLINVREGRTVFMPGGEAPNPDTVQQTSCRWIEQKAEHMNLSQIFCNNPLANYPKHLKLLPKPVDSFSPNNGAYVDDPVLKDESLNMPLTSAAKNLMRAVEPIKPAFSFARQFQPSQTELQNGPTKGLIIGIIRDKVLEEVLRSELTQLSETTFVDCIRKHLLLKRFFRRWYSFARNQSIMRRTMNIFSTFLNKIVTNQLELLAEKTCRSYHEGYYNEMAREIGSSQTEAIIDKLVAEQLYTIACKIRATQVRQVHERLGRIRENLQKKWLRQFTDHWLSVVRRNRILRSITFLDGNNNPSALTLPSSSGRLFRPEVKKITRERMQEMARERMRRIEEEKEREKRREEEEKEETQRRDEQRHISPAIAIRDHILNGASFQRSNGPPFGASANLGLFHPGVKALTPEMMQKMAQQKMRQNSRLNLINGTSTPNGFGSEDEEHTSPSSSSKRERFFYF